MQKSISVINKTLIEPEVPIKPYTAFKGRITRRSMTKVMDTHIRTLAKLHAPYKEQTAAMNKANRSSHMYNATG